MRRALREARERAEREKAEEVARRSEKELLDVIEAIPTMAFTTLADGSSTWVNRRWVEYSGLSVEDTSGSGWQATLHPDDLNGHVTKWQQSLASGEPFESEARHRRANGEYRWFLVRAMPLRDEQGKVRKWYGTLTDIEDRKRTEQERERLRHLEADLAYMSRVMTMGELAASLAHEIKQPIAAAAMDAKVCMRWLHRDEPDVMEACNAASAMVADVTRAAEIIDRVQIALPARDATTGIGSAKRNRSRDDRSAVRYGEPELHFNPHGARPRASGDDSRSRTAAAGSDESHPQWHRGNARHGW